MFSNVLFAHAFGLVVYPVPLIPISKESRFNNQFIQNKLVYAYIYCQVKKKKSNVLFFSKTFSFSFFQ